jgi:hypothetical protein
MLLNTELMRHDVCSLAAAAAAAAAVVNEQKTTPYG